MKCLYYEYKKLFGTTYIVVLVALLLAVNFFAAIPRQSAVDSQMPEFYAEYFSNKEEMDAYYREIVEYYRTNAPSQGEDGRIDRGEEAEELPSLPDRYSNAPGVTDRKLFEALYAEIESAESFGEDIGKVIDTAKLNLCEYAELGIDEDSYTYRYQEEVVKAYENVRENVGIGIEHSRGWSEFFSYGGTDLFIFVSILLVATVLFTQEVQSGFVNILKCTRKGRARTALAKVAALFVVTLFIVFAFNAVTFASVGLNVGFSSAKNAIQSVEGFRYCTLILNISQYFALLMFQKLAVFFVFALVTVLLSLTFGQYILTYIAGLAVYGISFLLYGIDYGRSDMPFKYLNFVSAANFNCLTERFRSFSFFSNAVRFYAAVPIISAVLIPLMIVGVIMIYRFGATNPRRLKVPKKLKFALPFRKKARPLRKRTTSVFACESYKTLVASRMAIVVVLLLIISAYTASREYKGINNFGDEVYKDYMLRLEGAISDEKDAFLMTERMNINMTVSRRSAMENAFRNREITTEEYYSYLNEYNLAVSISEPLKTVEAQRDYLKMQSMKGCDARYIYETGWVTLFEGGGSIWLYAAVLLVCAGIFADEYRARSYSGGFARIMRSTKCGRGRSYTAKIFSSLLITAVLFILFSATELYFIIKNYTLPALETPINSMQYFSAYEGSMTVKEYLIVFYALRFVAAELLCAFTVTVSCLMKNSLTAMSSVVSVTLIPSLLHEFGLESAKNYDFFAAWSGNRLFINSVTANMRENDLAYMFVFLAVCAAICAVTLWLSADKWCIGKIIDNN